MNNKHHYSIYVSDAAAQRLLERQESKSGFIAEILAEFAAGRLVRADDAKQRKLLAEARLAELKLEAFSPDRELKREALRADINLKVIAGQATSASLQRQLAHAAGTHAKHYILPNPAGDALDFFCPICFKTCASSVHVNETDYTRAKIAVVKHCVDMHGAYAARFDGVFPAYGHMERLLLGHAVRATADAAELDRLFERPDPEPPELPEAST